MSKVKSPPPRRVFTRQIGEISTTDFIDYDQGISYQEFRDGLMACVAELDRKNDLLFSGESMLITMDCNREGATGRFLLEACRQETDAEYDARLSLYSSKERARKLKDQESLDKKIADAEDKLMKLRERRTRIASDTEL